MKSNYRILGVNEKATDQEIRAAYTELRAKYKEEMFSDGEKGNAAAKKLTELERAYEEIVTERREKSEANDDGLLKDVDAAIKADDLNARRNFWIPLTSETPSGIICKPLSFTERAGRTRAKSNSRSRGRCALIPKNTTKRMKG